MRIWLLTIGEPVPISERGEDRLLRTGYFANLLANYGHDVVWWTSTFDHFRKQHLFSRDKSILLRNGLRINLLHGRGYFRNLSPSRLLDHRQIASRFSKFVRKQSPPDIIVSALPTIELSLAAVIYGKKHHVPVVLDMRDMWPDIFLDSVPDLLRPIARIMVRPLLRSARKACSEATAITGITDAFVEWGIRRGDRKRSSLDVAFPMGYISRDPQLHLINKAEQYWDKIGLSNESSTFAICYIGTVARWADIATVLNTARRLRNTSREFIFFVCGTGDRLEYYKNLASSDPNVIFTGWVDAAQIYVLMRRAKIGLDPLPDRYDFLATINNKAIEYLSAGLPVLSSPNRGVLSDFLKKYRCGMSYPHGNSEALEGLIMKLYENRKERQSMSQTASLVFNKMFTAEKVYYEMMEHLITIAETYKH